LQENHWNIFDILPFIQRRCTCCWWFEGRFFDVSTEGCSRWWNRKSQQVVFPIMKENKRKISSICNSEHGASAPTNPSSIKERLLAWCQQATKGYQVSSLQMIDSIVFLSPRSSACQCHEFLFILGGWNGILCLSSSLFTEFN
jgi:hypothetical protein